MQRSKLLRRSCIVGAAAAIVPAASLSLAQTRNWIGATNSDWSTASNWDTGVPNSSTSATFTGGTSQNQSVIINSPNSACFFLTDSGIQQIHAGSYPLAVGGDLNIYPQTGAGPASLTLQSGTVSAAGNTNVGGTSSGSVGAGYLEIDSGATLNVTGTTTIWSNGLPNSNGTLNLSGGTLSTAALNDGNNPSLLNWTSGTLSITSPNPFNIQSGQPLGGIVTLNSGMTLSLSNAQYVSEVGSVTINPGGQLNCANFLVGNGGNANLAVSGGSFGCSGLTIVGNGTSNSGALNVSGGGSLTTAILYDGLASSGTNTITVSGSGSTIVASSVIYVGSQNGGPSQFNVLSGGSVRANSSSGDVTVGSGGGNGVLTLGTAGTIDSGASLSSAGGIYVGGDSTSYSNSLGTGFIYVYGGTTLSTPGVLKVWNSNGSAVNLFGGTINAGSLDTTGVPNGFDWSTGTLNLTNSGLTLGTGQLLGAVLNLNTGKTLDMSGATTVTSSGSLQVSGGSLATPALIVEPQGYSGGAILQTAGTVSIGNVPPGGTISGGIAVAAGGVLDVAGWVTVGGLSITAGGQVNVTAGQLATQGQNLDVSGTLNISGGTVYLASISSSVGGSINWTAGTLGLTSNLTVGVGGPLGPTLDLNPNQQLELDGTGQVINVSGTLNCDGGTVFSMFSSESIIVSGKLNAAPGGVKTGAISIVAGGMCDVSGGWLEIDQGYFNISSGGSVNFASGEFFMNNSDVTVSPGGTFTWTGGDFRFTGPSLAGTISMSLALFREPASYSVRCLTVAKSVTLGGTSSAWTGRLDLAQGDLDVQNGSLGTITNQIAEGYNSGNWKGPAGIVSMSAAADSTHLTALGVIQNNQGGSALYTSFDGYTGVGPSDILIKYTYYGDANLDGKVDGSDYSLIDNGYLSQRTADPLSGWFNGDFNYDGVIDGSDYTLIDNAFNMQGAQLTDAIGNPAAIVTAEIAGTARVPEPSTAGLLGISVIGLLNLRRRRAIQ